MDGPWKTRCCSIFATTFLYAQRRFQDMWHLTNCQSSAPSKDLHKSPISSSHQIPSSTSSAPAVATQWTSQKSKVPIDSIMWWHSLLVSPVRTGPWHEHRNSGIGRFQVDLSHKHIGSRRIRSSSNWPQWKNKSWTWESQNSQKNPPLRKSQNDGKVDLKRANYSTTKDVLEQNVDCGPLEVSQHQKGSASITSGFQSNRKKHSSNILSAPNINVITILKDINFSCPVAKNAVLLTCKQFRSTGNSIDNLMLLPSTFAPMWLDHQLNWDGFNLESETKWLIMVNIIR